MAVRNLTEKISRISLHGIHALACTVQVIHTLVCVDISLVVERKHADQLTDVCKDLILCSRRVDAAVLICLECRR